MSIRERINSEPYRKRYQGCIVGTAAGDALGAPAEFMSPHTIQEEYGEVREMVGGGFMDWKPGEFTDDTDQTLIIVDSLISKKKYDPSDIARRLLRWFERGPKDVGGTTANSLSILRMGISWRDSGYMAKEMNEEFGFGLRIASNGSLMRTTPIGLYFRNHPESMDIAASEVSAITHADDECILACQFASQLVALLANGLSKEDAIDTLLKRYSPDTKVGREIRNILDNRVRPMGLGYVFDTLGIALSSFLYSDSFEEVTVKAVNAGGDTDTQAAVAGAMAGAHWGVDAIPFKWKVILNPVGSDKMVQKASKLYNLNRLLGNFP